jgi:hypothetical protein
MSAMAANAIITATHKCRIAASEKKFIRLPANTKHVNNKGAGIS